MPPFRARETAGVFPIAGILGSVFAVLQLEFAFSFHVAFIITTSAGVLVVGCMIASLRKDTFGLIVGCVTIFLALAFVVPTGATAFYRGLQSGLHTRGYPIKPKATRPR